RGLTNSRSCGFGGKGQNEVTTLIAGASHYICDECIGLCNDIIAEEFEREFPTESVASMLPESARVSVAAILARGASAAERVSTFGRNRKARKLTHEQTVQPHLAEPEKGKPSFEVLSEMSILASMWRGLDEIVARRAPDASPSGGGVTDPASASPRTEDELREWVRHITERLSFSFEVLDSLAKHLEEPGFDPSQLPVLV